jgi:ERCC4-type nuclease
VSIRSKSAIKKKENTTTNKKYKKWSTPCIVCKIDENLFKKFQSLQSLVYVEKA